MNLLYGVKFVIFIESMRLFVVWEMLTLVFQSRVYNMASEHFPSLQNTYRQYNSINNSFPNQFVFSSIYALP